MVIEKDVPELNTSHLHWKGSTVICPGDILMQGMQHEGMSGAAV